MKEITLHWPTNWPCAYLSKEKKYFRHKRQRIHNPDRLRQFDFISRAMTADTLKLDSLFRSLLQAENRRIEPWAATTLSYLNHPTRQDYAVKYIRPALEKLTEVQRTGDIFFPSQLGRGFIKESR